MVVEDRKEGNMCYKDLDDLQEALTNTKKKDKNHMLICQNNFQKIDATLNYHAPHLT